MPRAETSGFRLWALLVLAWSATAGAATVTIDGSVEHQTIRGGGLYYNGKDGQPVPIPTSDFIAQQYSLGLREIEMFFPDTWFELVNDDGDPGNFNWNNGANSFNAQFSAADAELQVAKAYPDAGFTVWPNFVMLPAWMMKADGVTFDASIPGVYDEIAEYWAAFLLYAKNNHGVDFPYLVFHHEPAVNTSTILSAAEIRDAIKRIGARLQAEGLNTRILAPKCCLTSYSVNYLQTILADSLATGYMAAIIYEPYDYKGDNPGVFSNLANDPVTLASGLPLWQGEWTIQRTNVYPKRSEAYLLTQNIQYALEFAKFMHHSYVEGRSETSVMSPGVGMEYGRDDGMFGPGLAAGGVRLKKIGHFVAQYNRFIEPGSKRIDASDPGTAGLFISAYRHPASGALAIVMLNKSVNQQSVTVNLSNLAAPADMRAVRTSASEDSAELGRVALSGNSLTVTLPGESVTSYVGSTVADSTPPSVPGGVSAPRP